jgi:hydrogenase/urease accessory protein HupE
VRRRRDYATLPAMLALLGAASAAHAHDARPLSISIFEQASHVYRVIVRVPPSLEAGNTPHVVWPGVCSEHETVPLAVDVGETTLIVCKNGLGGRQIRIEYPVYNPSITALIRVEAANGTVATTVLAPDELEWTVPTAPTGLAVARGYLAAGFRHIWGGPDHLLFVAGLMLLARRPRRVLLAVTGFTIAHSITLSLATLGVVHVPIPPVEAMIALSVLFLAGEVARPASESFSRRYPIALAFTFGLLHGFGFASALGEIGLPTRELATGLLSFNIGVELGQIAFIVGAALLFAAWARLRVLLAPARSATIHAWARVAGAYALGVPAALWFFERLAAAF